jgi:UDP-hydrolysing UDP-N-acetyl-D-glucosamine 2-epimerase
MATADAARTIDGSSPSSARWKICVVTGARSEYGLMRWPMAALKADPRFDLQIVATGSHLLEQFGFTYREIETDGFTIDEAIAPRGAFETKKDLARCVGDLTTDLAQALARLGPDIVFVMGDRYEILSVLAACVLMTIPIAHVSGGELTEGAIDEQIRHAMTKAAHIHFVANREFASRVRQMGEEDWRICVSGEPGLDNLRHLTLMSREELGRDLGLDLSRPTAIVTLHPETLAGTEQPQRLAWFIDAIERSSLNYILTYPNADEGSHAIIEALSAFKSRNPHRCVLVKSLGQVRYLSALKHVDLMIGNSSSGLFEAPSFNLPVVNIGDRQKGRLRAKNVIDVSGAVQSVLGGIDLALRYDRRAICENPYGDGFASEKIVDFFAATFSAYPHERLLRKRFVDYS